MAEDADSEMRYRFETMFLMPMSPSQKAVCDFIEKFMPYLLSWTSD